MSESLFAKYQPKFERLPVSRSSQNPVLTTYLASIIQGIGDSALKKEGIKLVVYSSDDSQIAAARDFPAMVEFEHYITTKTELSKDKYYLDCSTVGDELYQRAKALQELDIERDKDFTNSTPLVVYVQDNKLYFFAHIASAKSADAIPTDEDIKQVITCFNGHFNYRFNQEIEKRLISSKG